MAKFTIVKNNLSSGELSQKLRTRVDSKEYKNGLSLDENFVPLPDGGSSFRPGFWHTKMPGTDFQGGILFPFVFSKTEAYIIQLNNAGRFPGVTSPIEIFDVDSPGTTITVTWVNSIGQAIDPRLDPKGFRYFQKHDVMYITHTSSLMPPILLVRNSATDFSIDFFNSTLLSAVNLVWFLRTPYAAPNTSAMTLTPSAVTGNITLTSSTTYFTAKMIGKMFRLNHAGAEGICEITAIAGITQNVASVNTTTNHFTLVGHGYSTGDQVMFGGTARLPEPLCGIKSCADVYYVYKVDADTFGVCETSAAATAANIIDITAAYTGNLYIYDATTEVNSCSANVKLDFGANTATDNWRESSWDNHNGWPKVGTFFELRAYFLSTLNNPDYYWGSLTDNIYWFMGAKLAQDSATNVSGLNYYGSVANTDAFGFPVRGHQLNIIQWVRAKETLQVGTMGEEHILSGYNDILGPLSVSDKIQTSEGGNDSNALGVDNMTMYISRDGKSTREFVYNEANGSYVSNTISMLSPEIIAHTFDGDDATPFNTIQIKQLAYQASRKCVWFVTSLGALIGCIYSRETQAVAWFRMTLGGTDVFVHSVAVTPAVGGKTEYLYALVSRTINSATVYKIERMGSNFEHSSLLASGDDDYLNHFDSGAFTLLASDTDTVNISNMEGETLGVLVDGLLHADCTVAGGAITLDQAYPTGTLVTYGLKYEGKLKLFRPEGGGEFGSSFGLVKRIDRVMISLYKTLGLKIGRDEDTLEDCDEITGHPYTSGTLEPFSGDIIKYFNGDNDTDSFIYLKQDLPYPCTILSIFLRGVTYD